jgi:hypothetical protein
MKKPHLRFRNGLWECASIRQRGIGYGSTPKSAFFAWLMREPVRARA